MKTLASNTKVEYTYRDASNYKVHQECVIQGPITQQQIRLILESCDCGEFFVPSKVHPQMPCKRFDDYDPDLDHEFFEIGEFSFVPTTEVATIQITAEELVKRFRAVNQQWFL